jgi:hypothetical protein
MYSTATIGKQIRRVDEVFWRVCVACVGVAEENMMRHEDEDEDEMRRGIRNVRTEETRRDETMRNEVGRK